MFVPTGSASPDYYGGLRPGDDKWANSVVALRGKTGEFVWGFPARPPRSLGLRFGRAAVADDNQARWQRRSRRNSGQQDRFPVCLESRYRRARVSGRRAPRAANGCRRGSDFSDAAVSRSRLRRSVPAKAFRRRCMGHHSGDRDVLPRGHQEALRNDGLFTPPSIQGTLSVPGNVGGMNWSGYAYDAQRGLLLVNTNNLPARDGTDSCQQILGRSR